MPRLDHLAGLELGTGVQLCIVAPEQAAAALLQKPDPRSWRLDV